MSASSLFSPGVPPIVAALHLPPFPGAAAPQTFPISKIIDYAVRNVERARRAGIRSVYLQDVGDRPVAPTVQPHTIAGITAVGSAIQAAFPDLILGVCLMGNSPSAALAIAQAISARFVRIKVYVGVMVKPEGLVEGSAYEAVKYRQECGMTEMHILADIYDRTGMPLGAVPVSEAARQAVQLGRADGLVLTGGSYRESISMLNEVREKNLGVPLFLGGGATAQNCGEVLRVADGIIVSSSFTHGERQEEGMPAEWDLERMQQFMDVVSA